jgi:hypothetical protein
MGAYLSAGANEVGRFSAPSENENVPAIRYSPFAGSSASGDGRRSDEFDYEYG